MRNTLLTNGLLPRGFFLKSALALWASLTPLFVLSASACDCVPPNSALESLHSSTHVFLGEVVSKKIIALNELQEGYKEVLITFRVMKHWKGTPERLFTIRSPLKEEDCGLELENGKPYLVYSAGGAVPYSSACNRVYPINSIQATRDLEQLGDGTLAEVE